MEGRNFHTSLIGGFRKKDVVSFLAEEKRQHEDELQNLQQQLSQTEQQLDDVRAQSGAAAEELQEQLKDVRQSREAVEQQLEAVREEKTALEVQLQELRAQFAVEKQALEQENQALLEQAHAFALEREQWTERNALLQEMMEELQNRPQPEPECQTAPAELAELRQALQAERERVQALDAQLRQQPGKREGMEHLWSLCSKMERTLGQMERMLDGPYRMTCYPEPPLSEPEEEPVFTMPVEPEKHWDEEWNTPKPQEKSKPSVSSLLQRVRRKK